jgi:2-polyprenyl-6-methoxyphenol hydroxylase-like FAD-dependent oxidoreductase
MPDALIIGAGPAGALTALLLARSRWQVTLVEQHPFPRDKVCGECLSALGIAVLHRADLTPRLLTAHPVPITSTTLHAQGGHSVRLRLDEPMWGLSRFTLDHLLLEAVKEAGTNVLQPARCESLTPGNPPHAVVRDLRSNQLHTFHPDVILLADGKGALLPRRPQATADFGIKTHFTHVAAPRDTIELFGVHGHYGGVGPIEDDRWNAAFSIPAAEIQRVRGDLDDLFDRMLGQNVELRRRFATARRASAWHTSPLPRFGVSDSWPAGIIPLGNAAAALEPIGGEGMGLALRSAELAAETLIADPTATHSLRTSFKNLWKIRRPACRMAAKLLSSTTFAGPTIELLSSNDSLGGLALKMIGK